MDQLKQYCSNFFRACCLFTRSISPTSWSIGHIIPARALYVFNKYHLGLHVSQWKGANPTTWPLEGTAKTLTFLVDGVRFFPMNLCSWCGYGRKVCTKRRTLSTSRHTFRRGLPKGNLVSVDLRLIHRNKSAVIAHTSKGLKLRKVLSWKNLLLSRSLFSEEID